ncbi:hypothetical protein GCM10012275_64680 [Longimycelium tulufanense]|uniref:Uncharacterized protein n=1 Tax=Longimycelium tulufanense TaxID=907463 RepID=A0A8J3CL18_9PSEU|nr:hypothetical protein [Longimycelium tulufanense]GGM84981.1 hypothetical protein GCM10012275_64680 [Longimycelium tulufanense]
MAENTILNLDCHLSWPANGGTATGNCIQSVADNGLIVNTPSPFYDYGGEVVAVPDVTLTGTTLTFDLTQWQLVDMRFRRTVTIAFHTTTPGAPKYRGIAARYVREARHLMADQVETWAAQIIAEDNQQASKEAEQ